MAPKNLPPAAKQAKILEWFRTSMGVYSLKELEKLLPAVASIHQCQVKDYLQNLTDENQVRVEKIGSGNWYWSFLSDTKKAMENIINSQKMEESKLMASIEDLERQIEEETAKRHEDEEMLERNGMDRKTLLQTYETLTKELEILENELAGYSDSDPTEMLRRKEEATRFENEAMRWTDNLESMEYFLIQQTNDRVKVAGILENCCQGEYVIGEGFKEL